MNFVHLFIISSSSIVIVLNFSCIMEMMRSLKENKIINQTDARNYIGKLFKIKFYDLPPWTTDDQVCQHILK